MAKTGFFDNSQKIYLPKDSLTWADLGNSPYATWDNWANWYQNLTTSTTVEFTRDILLLAIQRVKKLKKVVILSLEEGFQ